MREIKFRGKWLGNEIWIYGSLLKSLECRIFDDSGNMCGVDPETVGQYTGLHEGTKWEQLFETEQNAWLNSVYYTDNGKKHKHKKKDWNGNEIYEGDILRNYDYFRPIKEKDLIVTFCGGSFCIHNLISVIDCDCGIVYNGITYDYRVIGNIHDNPELLEKGGN